jgi:CO/xanthine dehydrogenase Mo-binding subunit
MEHIIVDGEGRIINLGALDYRIPTIPRWPGPVRSKGRERGALLCTAPPLAAAITQATGVVIRDLPVTPERLWRALRDGAGPQKWAADVVHSREIQIP